MGHNQRRSTNSHKINPNTAQFFVLLRVNSWVNEFEKEMNKNPADTTVSHYRILSKIGAGGMGEVYLAEDTKLDRKVAIKFLNQEFSKDSDRLNRFIQEAKAALLLKIESAKID